MEERKFKDGEEIKGRGLIGDHVWTVVTLKIPTGSLSEYQPYYILAREDSKKGEIKKILGVDAAEHYDVFRREGQGN